MAITIYEKSGRRRRLIQWIVKLRHNRQLLNEYHQAYVGKVADVLKERDKQIDKLKAKVLVASCPDDKEAANILVHSDNSKLQLEVAYALLRKNGIIFNFMAYDTPVHHFSALGKQHSMMVNKEITVELKGSYESLHFLYQAFTDQDLGHKVHWGGASYNVKK